MPRPTRNLHIDFETYCDLDLKKVGTHQYVSHPSFRVLCVAWKFEGRPAVSELAWSTMRGMPPDLTEALKSPDVQVHAFNAAFETAVLNQLAVLAHPISCTMQRALAYGLPGKLEAAAAAAGLAHQKDMAGHRLMLKMSRPLKPGAPAWTMADARALMDYCAKDVEAEAALSAVIPELPPEERELSVLDALMNTSGELGVDRARVTVMRTVAEVAEKRDAARCAILTGGAVNSPGTQTARLMAWFTGEGIVLPDTTRASIEEALLTWEGTANWAVIAEVLAIRLRAARASTRKLVRMLDMSDAVSGALRGQFQFAGAGRTGRWSGRGVQVQNLPRIPKGFDPGLFGDMALACVTRGDMAEFDRVTSAPVLDCVSWSLRSCLKATKDERALWSFDFAQIEARVLAWLAGQSDVLAVFASGDDVYVWAAAQFGSGDRQLGKVLVLALGFGMGAVKLRETAWKNYGVRLTASQAERFKVGWRQANGRIVAFWQEMEGAAKQAILNRGSVYAVGGSGVAFTSTARTLQMRLPSGRVLYYHKPYIASDTGSICYWGAEVGGRWVLQRTWGGKLAENATQAAARDIMSEAMLRAWRRERLVPCMTVHDELVYPVDRSVAAQDTPAIEKLMLEAPPWAGGLPLAGEYKVMHRYGVAVSFMAIANGP
jgi:DNA polymerase